MRCEMEFNCKILLDNGVAGEVSYVAHMGDDLTIVNAARVSFSKRKKLCDESDEKLIAYLIQHRHTSPFEHNVITFLFKVPIYIRAHHFRHRTWSFNEISRRYTSENMCFYNPKFYRTQHENNRQASNKNELINPQIEINNKVMSVHEHIENHYQKSMTLYQKMIEAGVCREQARGVLPQNLFTEYYGTVNLSNLIKFIELRAHEDAQWEVQLVAKACLDIAGKLYPVTIKSYREQNQLHY